MGDSTVQKLLALAEELASKQTDSELNKAADILLHLINTGCEDPEILVRAATYLLQGPRRSEFSIKQKAISLLDKVVALSPDNISVLEKALACYELTLNDFPEKLNIIVRLALKILEIDPDHIEAMITLAYHREHPCVALSLADTIRMLEWAREVEPDNFYVSFSLARLYIEAGKYNLANSQFQQVLANSEPDSWEALDAGYKIKFLHSKSKIKRHPKYGFN